VSNTASVEELATANLALNGESLAWKDFDAKFGKPGMADMKGGDIAGYVDEERVDELKLGGKLIAITKK
jgi:hypothetical protein